MTLDLPHLTGTVVTAAFVLFIIYRRFRRNFGRQPLRPKRMVFRIAVLALVGVLLLPSALFSTEIALAIFTGLLLGLALGFWAGQHTRFEQQPAQLYYIPHTYTGMLVSALFLGRIIYRFFVLSPVLTQNPITPTAPPPADTVAAMQHNPATLGILYLLIAYYVYYYSYVLWESRHLKTSDLENPPPPPVTPISP